MTTMHGLSDADGNLLISDALRMFVGHGKRITWAALAAATQDKERKLRSYVEQDAPRHAGAGLHARVLRAAAGSVRHDLRPDGLHVAGDARRR
jgi:hypothetical protein